MDVLSRDELKALIEAPRSTCVSIFLPTHRTGAEIQQSPIRLKNLLRQAEEGLVAMGLREREAKELLQPIERLLPERPFWQHQGDGLALFRSPELFRAYRLPLKVEELAVVNDRFHVKPLLPMLSDGRFYLLALSQKEVRFFHATRFGIQQIPLPPGAPSSLAEALALDDLERQLQFHTRAPKGRGERDAMFFGQGAGEEETKEHLLRFFQQLDTGLHPLLREERVPLVLAGVEYLFPIYREANRYPYLIEPGVKGNPEGLRPEELHEQALAVVEPHLEAEREAAAARYRQLVGTGFTSNNVVEIVPSSYQGRVELLFVAVGAQQWGRFDPATQTVELHDEPEAGDEDLLNVAAVQTFVHRGTVYAVAPKEVPDEAPLAAVYRY